VLPAPATSGTFEAAYGLWLASWETAVRAVATATEIRMLSLKAAAEQRAAIAAERKLVIEELTLLTGRVHGEPMEELA
jgi:hypothetical protein